jgi:hypothetical protein
MQNDIPLWFFIASVAVLLLICFMVQCFVSPWQLYQRGIKTTGTVIENNERIRYTSYGKRVYHIVTIQYQTHTTPPLTCTIKKREDLEIDSQVLIYYDYLRPSGLPV